MIIRNLLFCALLLAGLNAKAQLTRVHFINNSADISLGGIDIYINNVLTVDDLFFRTSTAFIDLPAGSPITIGIGDATSVNFADTFYSITTTLNPNNIYVMVANGVKSTTGYTPLKPFQLHIYNKGKQGTAVNYTSILFMNGATDAPAMDIRTGITTMADNLNYGDYAAEYHNLTAPGIYNIRLTNPTGNKTTHNFELNLNTLNLSAEAVVILTSGFIDPSSNSNGPDFGLWLSKAQGGALIDLTPITNAEKLARIQFIHNSADTGIGKVDLYVDGEPTVDSLDYLYATGFIDAFAGNSVAVAAGQAGKAPFFNTNIALDSGKTYIAVLNGIKSDTNYKPKVPVSLDVFPNAKEESGDPTKTDILFMHGSTDAPVTDFDGLGGLSATNLNYKDFSSGYGQVNASSIVVVQVDTGANNNPLEQYAGILSNWNVGGKTMLILSSGFVVPDSNSNGPAFGLWAASSSGGQLQKLIVWGDVSNLNAKGNEISVWPVPANKELHFNKANGNAIVAIINTAGAVVKQQEVTDGKIGIAELPAGNYLLLLRTGDKLYHTRFIKE